MPRNAEYLVYAFGISITVISIYFLRTMIKLRSIRKKLNELTNRNNT